MNLLEHEAKRILKEADIPVPQSSLMQKGSSYTGPLPVVLKSQVPVGGRGKAGGIKVVSDTTNLQPVINGIFALDIKGFTPQSLLAEEALAIDKELYLSLIIDRPTASIKLIAHTNGGVEVEENKNFASWPLDYVKPDFDTIGQALADYYELSDQTFVLQDLIQNLFTCFKKNDATLIEINPLILTKQDVLIAGDAKMTLDDAAGFRHPEWQFENSFNENNFVTISQDGNIATVANGAGLAMATVDAAYNAGFKPANFLDIGGGATAESLLDAFKKMEQYPHLKAIIINIFAGITRSDEVAKAIIEARSHLPNLPPLYIRLAGTNYEEASWLLHEADITILPSLEACLEAAKELLDE